MTSHNRVAELFSQGISAKGSRMYSDGHGDNLRLYSYGSHFILAVILKESGHFLLNGDRYSSSTSKHQSITRRYCKPNIIVPFSALRSAGIDGGQLEDLQVIDRTEDQTREVQYTDPKTGEPKTRIEHLLGACIFKHGKKYLLSGVDTDAKSWGQGYFLVELPRPVKTVQEAYESLKPKDMQPHEEFKRQGEFFFIPSQFKTKDLKKISTRRKVFEWVTSRQYQLDEYDTSNLEEFIGQLEATNCPMWAAFEPRLQDREWSKDKVVIHYRRVKDFQTGEIMKRRNLALIVGGNDSGNAHQAREVFIVKDGLVFARGAVRHSQHKTLSLGETWHRVLINQAKASFSSGGNVD